MARKTAPFETALEEARRLVRESRERIAYRERRLTLMSWCEVKGEMAIGPALLLSHHAVLEVRLANLAVLEEDERQTRG